MLVFPSLSPFGWSFPTYDMLLSDEYKFPEFSDECTERHSSSQLEILSLGDIPLKTSPSSIKNSKCYQFVERVDLLLNVVTIK